MEWSDLGYMCFGMGMGVLAYAWGGYSWNEMGTHRFLAVNLLGLVGIIGGCIISFVSERKEGND